MAKNKINIRNVFDSVSGNNIVSIDTLTTVPLKGGKSNPMQGRITKKVTGSSVMVFQNKNTNGYENMVKRRLEAEGKDPESFVLGPRKWGTRVPETPFIEHVDKKGVVKHYLESIFLRSGNTEYFLDGKPIAVTEIQGIDDAETVVSEKVQGGLENQVIIRTYDVNNIIGVRVDGNVYEGTFAYDA